MINRIIPHRFSYLIRSHFILIILFSCSLSQQAVAQTPALDDTTEAQTDSIESTIDSQAPMQPDTGTGVAKPVKKFMTGADQVKAYATFLKGKKVAIVVNQTSRVGNVHLIDTLLALKINIVTIFTPEHGLTGDIAAGEKVANSIAESGVPIVSLYGNHLKPTKKDMKDIDIVLYDIQDVGARFYTYISTLHYVMEACAENQKPLIVLDRPNPNGFYVDGPVLNPKFRSFVGMDQIPVVYGLTIGELAKMMNMEGWIKGAPCGLRVIKMKNYTHNMMYNLSTAPSPNLTNMKAIYLYPSLCFFEGTRVSVGRGTDRPFQQFGYPGLNEGDVTFTPQIVEAAPDPMYKDSLCRGWDATSYVEDTTKLPKQLNLTWLIQMYDSYPDKKNFFTPFFDKLAGGPKLREQIQKGMTEDLIRESWQEELSEFMMKRKRYLLYADFGEKSKKGTAKAAKRTPAQKPDAAPTKKRKN